MKAKKSLGQNFLTHRGTLNKILAAANLSPTDHVIEIGPGKGVLTAELLERVNQVEAIELDDRLIPILTEKFPNLKIHHQDALKFTPPKTPYKLVANIPYYITSPIINHFLREQPPKQRPQSLTLLVQKEVAQKICAKPGKLSVLALQVQLFGTPKLIAKVPPSHFSPKPKVDSAILHIEISPEPLTDKIDQFFNLIHRGFAHKRKKLIRNLGLTPKEFPFPENSRAEELTLQDWLNLLS
jgi:16S rRNA (adenine1518-N6/adenine1519-N6)-dimethyltransferase